MKIKSLLFAAIAVFSVVSASAQDEYIDCKDKLSAESIILRSEIGTVNVYLTRELAPDFTNIQFDLVFPEGIYPVLDEDEVYDWAGDDIPMVGKPKVPCVSFRNNFQRDDFYPEHTVVGVNMTKTAVLANPCQLYCFNIAADERMLNVGTYQIMVKNLKYTTKDNEAYRNLDEQVLCNVEFSGGIVGRIPYITGITIKGQKVDLSKRESSLTLTESFTKDDVVVTFNMKNCEYEVTVEPVEGIKNQYLVTVTNKEEYGWYGDNKDEYLILVTVEDIGTGINTCRVDGTSQVSKKFENGQVVIVKGDKKFNMAGQEIK